MSQRTSSGLQDDLQQVRHIVTRGLAGHPARVWLFGSQARGQPRRTSDIDVAVLPLEPLPPGLLSGIREALEESTVLPNVDLVDLTEAEPALREQVEREGVPWTS